MGSSELEIRHIDPGVLRDLASRHSDVLCPVHGVAPRFDVEADGSVVETLCCAALLQIVRELEASDSEAPES